MPDYFSLFMVVKDYLNTTRESRGADRGHAVRDINGGQAYTTTECIITNGCHPIGDYGTFTPQDQCVVHSLDNGIATITGVKKSVSLIHFDEGQVATPCERLGTDSSHAFFNHYFKYLFAIGIPWYLRIIRVEGHFTRSISRLANSQCLVGCGIHIRHTVTA